MHAVLNDNHIGFVNECPLESPPFMSKFVISEYKRKSPTSTLPDFEAVWRVNRQFLFSRLIGNQQTFFVQAR